MQVNKEYFIQFCKRTWTLQPRSYCTRSDNDSEISAKLYLSDRGKSFRRI